MLRHKEIMKCA